jgi:phosphohistidine phosphatase
VNLFLLRHGAAVERGEMDFQNDSDRPLTTKGRRQLRQAAAAMLKMKLRFDLILSSPLLRARQTAEIIAVDLKLERRLKFSAALAPDASAKILLRELNEFTTAPENVLLVGHEPGLSHLISLLAGGDGNLAVDFKKGGLCKLEMQKPRFGQCAQLMWLLTPKQMKLMG